MRAAAIRKAPAPGTALPLARVFDRRTSWARRLAVAALLAGIASSSAAASGSANFTVTIILNGGDPAVAVAAPPAPVPPVPPGPSTGGSGGNTSNPGPATPPTGGAGGSIPTGGGTGGSNPGSGNSGNTGSGNSNPPTSGGGAPAVPANPPVTVPTSPPVVAAGGSICTSVAQSDATNAQVRVVCSTGQFVSIEPAPGRPFVGTHGGAYRYSFGPNAPIAVELTGIASLQIGAGTVTALRVLNLAESETPLEMLVSF